MTKTPNLNLNVPDYRDLRWDVPVNENWNLIDTAVAEKQDIIPDLAEIRSNAQAGKNIIPQVEVNTQRIEDLTVARFPNVIVKGTPQIIGGQVSGFSSANYLQFPFVDISRGYPFDIYFSFTTAEDVMTQQNILDSYYGIALAIQNGKGLIALSSNGTSWDIGTAVGTNTLTPNTTYYVKCSWTGTAYTAALSQDDQSYIPDMNIASSVTIHKTTIFIGGSPNLFGAGSAHPFKGTINFNNSKVVVNGITVWEGMSDVGLASRANVSLNNLDEVGEARFTNILNETGSTLDYTGTTLSLENAKGDTLSSVTIKLTPDIANWSNNITNCITEIPQDIKLELNNGTLTLKAGSKVYVPNGAGVFDEVITTLDYSISGAIGANNTKIFIAYRNNAITTRPISSSVSGSGATTTSGFAYDTSTNKINFYNSSGELKSEGYSFPIAIISTDSVGIAASIDQVFNGFGYIGSTVFALPGVKGLIPNGRNADGSLKNVEIATDRVRVEPKAGTLNGLFFIRLFTDNIGAGSLTYKTDENFNYINNIKRDVIAAGIIIADGSKITSLTPKTAFHAVDYNDAVKYSDKAEVVGWGIPDYTAGIAVTTFPFTASVSGYIIGNADNASSNTTLYIDSVAVGHISPYETFINLPIEKNSVLTKSNNFEISNKLVFYPMKGVS